MADTPPPLPPVQAQPVPPPLPVTPDPSVKRKRARIIIGAVVTAAITIAAACGVDVCSRLASFGWTPSVCATAR